jgi:hypothetical protein
MYFRVDIQAIKRDANYGNFRLKVSGNLDSSVSGKEWDCETKHSTYKKKFSRTENDYEI